MLPGRLLSLPVGMHLVFIIKHLPWQGGAVLGMETPEERWMCCGWFSSRLPCSWLRILSPFKWDSGRSASAREGLLSLWEPILKQPLITTTKNNSNSSLRWKVKRKIQSSLRSQHTRHREMLSLINKIHIPSNRKLCFYYKEILALPPKLLSTPTHSFKAKPGDILC